MYFISLFALYIYQIVMSSCYGEVSLLCVYQNMSCFDASVLCCFVVYILFVSEVWMRTSLHVGLSLWGNSSRKNFELYWKVYVKSMKYFVCVLLVFSLLVIVIPHQFYIQLSFFYFLSPFFPKYFAINIVTQCI
jgi:hypothetical protein